MKSAMRHVLRAMTYKTDWLVRRMRRYEHARVKLVGRALFRWVRRYKHRPLSMLGECYGRQCPNSRLLYPHRRTELVSHVISEVQSLWGNSVEHMTFLLFGSGSLLQEVIMLTKLCAAINIETITVVCCDAEYASENADEEFIINARFEQAQEWMSSVAPKTTWKWSRVSALDPLPRGEEKALFFAADIPVTDELWTAAQVRLNKDLQVPSLMVMLDDEGMIHIKTPCHPARPE